MLAAIRELFIAMGRFVVGIFMRDDKAPTPPAPVPPVFIPAPLPGLPPVAVIPAPPPPLPSLAPAGTPAGWLHGPQTPWWDGGYVITQSYGCTDLALEGHNPYHPECAYFHEGIDYAIPLLTPIFAGRKLTVVEIDPVGYGPPGNSAAIRLNVYEGTVNPDIWIYHMNDYAVKAGDVIERGTLIGHSGTRGYSTGPHLHFEVRPAGTGYRHSIRPDPWLGFRYG